MLGKRESGDLLRSLMEKMLKKRGIGNGLNICQHQKLEGKIFVPCYDRKSYFCQEISLILPLPRTSEYVFWHDLIVRLALP